MTKYSPAFPVGMPEIRFRRPEGAFDAFLVSLFHS
jgi:hypothetical protein